MRGTIWVTNSDVHELGEFSLIYLLNNVGVIQGAVQSQWAKISLDYF